MYAAKGAAIGQTRGIKSMLITISKETLSPEEHIQEKVRNMHILLANMRVAFNYIDEEFHD